MKRFFITPESFLYLFRDSKYGHLYIISDGLFKSMHGKTVREEGDKHMVVV